MAKKFKIGIDARLYRRSSGGIGRYTHALLENLARIDPINNYFIFLTDEDLKEYKLKAKNFKAVRANYPHYSLQEQLGFLRQLNSYQLDLVHFTNFNHPIFYRRKFVATIHDMTMTLFPAPGKQKKAIDRFFYHLVLKNAINRAQRIIVDSRHTKKDLVRIIQAPKKKISVVYLGVDDNYHPDKDEGKIIYLANYYHLQKPYLLFVSQWRPHKGIENLVKAFEILDARFKNKDLRLVITGKPNPKFPKIEEGINRSPLRQRIITPGFVDEKDMVALYSNAAVFVFPSIYEGFGLNPLEAMACGTPVTASNISCIPEACGQAALYFDPYDPEDMALKIQTLLTNDKLRQEFISRGFKNLEKFSWQKMALETLEIYKSALEG